MPVLFQPVVGEPICISRSGRFRALGRLGSGGGVAPPGIPQNLIAEPGDSLVTLDWDAVVGATTYNVYRGGVFLKDVDALGTEAVDDTAVNGVTYSYTVSATGPGGESAQSAAAVVTLPFPMDMLLDFVGVTPGTALDTTILAAAKVGGAGWNFTYSDSVVSLNHTSIATFAPTRPSVNVGGTNYSGAEAVGVKIDMSARTGADGAFEGYILSSPVAFAATSMYVCGLNRFPLAGDPDNATNAAIDHKTIYGGSAWGVMQQIIVAGGVDNVTAGHVLAHASGTPEFGVSIQIDDTTVYFYGLLFDADDALAKVVLINNNTGVLVGYSQAGLSATDAIVRVIDHDYLISFGGTTYRKAEAFNWTDVSTFPGRLFTISTPTISSCVQTDPDEVTVEWSASAANIKYRVERSSNSGATWSTLAASQSALSYVDGTVSDAATYLYKITALLLGTESSGATSDPLTIDDSGFLQSYSDNFNRANEFPANTPWSPQPGHAAGTLWVLGNKGYCNGGPTLARLSTPAFLANQSAQCVVVANNCGPTVRSASDADASCYGLIPEYDFGAGFYTLRIYKFTDNGATVTSAQLGAALTSTDVWTGSGKLLKLKATGTNPTVLEGFLDGVSLGTRSDSSSPITSGQPGVTGEDGAQVDSFFATEL